jgi:hypothetical protein
MKFPKLIHYSTNTCQSCQATIIFISENNIIVNSFEASINQVSQYYKLELLDAHKVKKFKTYIQNQG